MADATSRKRLKEIRSQCGNNICVECGKLNPQWISVTYGIWMCIECSGKHRLLGLHLSQIKSITMDKWTEKEIEKIQHGGNKNFKDFIESHSAFNSQWTFEERYQSQLMALYRDKLTMESAGEIWIEEESPIYLQMKSQVQPLSNGTSMQEVKLEETTPTEVPSDKDATGDSPILEPIKVVEVEVQEPLDTFSRLGQGLSLATSFVKETTKQAAEELNEFKNSHRYENLMSGRAPFTLEEANKTLEDTRANVTGTLSSWGGWASSLAKTVTEKIDDEITKIATADTTPKLTGEGEDADLGGSFWSNFGQKKPPTMCMSVSTISEPEDN